MTPQQASGSLGRQLHTDFISIHFAPMKGSNGCMRLRVIGHFDESESFGCSFMSVHHDRAAMYLAMSGKECLKLMLCGGTCEV